MCGSESLLPGCGCLSTTGGPSQAQIYSSAKMLSIEYDSPPGLSTTNPASKDIGRTYSSQSQHSRHSQCSHNSQTLAREGSQDCGVVPIPLPPGRRKRPLAVAVGFKYAEDINGRPIVITPGNRRIPVRAPRSRCRSSAPASKIEDITQKDARSSTAMPIGFEDGNRVNEMNTLQVKLSHKS